jgi:hypothetical protein
MYQLIGTIITETVDKYYKCFNLGQPWLVLYTVAIFMLAEREKREWESVEHRFWTVRLQEIFFVFFYEAKSVRKCVDEVHETIIFFSASVTIKYVCFCFFFVFFSPGNNVLI